MFFLMNWNKVDFVVLWQLDSRDCNGPWSPAPRHEEEGGECLHLDMQCVYGIWKKVDFHISGLTEIHHSVPLQTIGMDVIANNWSIVRIVIWICVKSYIYISFYIASITFCYVSAKWTLDFFTNPLKKERSLLQPSEDLQTRKLWKL